MIEAMACGTPVIAWDCGSVPEVVEHGVTGFIVAHRGRGGAPPSAGSPELRPRRDPRALRGAVLGARPWPGATCDLYAGLRQPEPGPVRARPTPSA